MVAPIMVAPISSQRELNNVNTGYAPEFLSAVRCLVLQTVGRFG